ncbi:MAG: mechanosensitive ion channel [Holosporales bacterium]|nr:mechanosensitive ion channel [Holosporales bacterium]
MSLSNVQKKILSLCTGSMTFLALLQSAKAQISSLQEVQTLLNTETLSEGYTSVLLYPFIVFIIFLIVQFWASWILERALIRYINHSSKIDHLFFTFGSLCRSMVPIALFALLGFYEASFLQSRSLHTFYVTFVGTLSSAAFLRLFAMAVLSPYTPHARLFRAAEIHMRSLWSFIKTTLWITSIGIITVSSAQFLLEFPKTTITLTKHSLLSIALCYMLLSVFRARSAIKDLLNSTHKENNISVWIDIFCALNKRWWIFLGYGGVLLLGLEFYEIEFKPANWLKPLAISLITIAGMQFIISCILWLPRKVRRILKESKAQNSTFLERAQKSLTQIESLTIAIFYIFLVLLIGHFCGLSIFHAASTPWGHIILVSFLGNAFLMCAGIVLYQALTLCIDYKITLVQAENPEKEKRLRTFLPLLKSVFHVAIFFVVLAGIVENLGFSIAPLLAGFSVLGLAISFGAQEVTKSFIQGTIVLIEDDMDTGDYVTINGISGFVERMSIRAVYVREVSGTLHVIPYSTVSAFCNLSRDYTLQIYELTIDPRENVAKVTQALEEVGQELLTDDSYKEQVTEPVQIFGITPFDLKGITLIWAIKTHPDPLKLVGFEFHRRLKKKFDTMGIDVPVQPIRCYTAADPLFTQQRHA